MTSVWVVPAWASNMVLTAPMGGCFCVCLFVLFFRELQIQGFTKVLFKLDKDLLDLRWYLFWSDSGLISVELSNNFHMCRLIKDLKLAQFHLSFSQDVVTRVSL